MPKGKQICACQVTCRNVGPLIFPAFPFPPVVPLQATFTLAVSHGGHTSPETAPCAIASTT
jgi:hypothetical protein